MKPLLLAILCALAFVGVLLWVAGDHVTFVFGRG
jgi:hypothetical protein